MVSYCTRGLIIPYQSTEAINAITDRYKSLDLPHKRTLSVREKNDDSK